MERRMQMRQYMVLRQHRERKPIYPYEVILESMQGENHAPP
jgi:hypothetical protein